MWPTTCLTQKMLRMAAVAKLPLRIFCGMRCRKLSKRRQATWTEGNPHSASPVRVPNCRSKGALFCCACTRLRLPSGKAQKQFSSLEKSASHALDSSCLGVHNSTGNGAMEHGSSGERGVTGAVWGVRTTGGILAGCRWTKQGACPDRGLGRR